MFLVFGIVEWSKEECALTTTSIMSNGGPLTTALSLINRGSNEEKVVGIVLAEKYASELNSDGEKNKVYFQVIKEVTPSFLVKMLKVDGETKGFVRESSLNMLSYACRNIKITALLKSEIGSFINITFKTVYNEQTIRLLNIVKSVVQVLNDADSIHYANVILQEYTANPTSLQPIQVLELVLAAVKTVKSSNFALPSKECESMRGLFVQVFHGAAPETVRDAALSYCSRLLAASRTLSPLWTITTSDKPSSATHDQTAASANKAAEVSFPILLCSIVRGELHLLSEEWLCLATLTSSEVEKYTAENTPTHTTGSANTSGDNAASENSSHIGTNTTNNSNSNNDSQMANIAMRISRCAAIHATCMNILDSVLELLVGSADSGDASSSAEEESEAVGAVWAGLPYHTLLDVKKSVDGTLKELFDFAQECGTILSARTDSPSSAATTPVSAYVMTRTQLRNVASRTVRTLCAYVAEDSDGLNSMFVDHLPAVLSCSVFGETYSSAAKPGKANKCNAVSAEQVWVAVTSAPADRADGMNLSSVQVGDCVQHALPCVVNILNALLDSEAANSPEEQQLLDRLGNKLDYVMPRAAALLTSLLVSITQQFSVNKLPAKSSSSSSSFTALNRGIRAAVVAVDLLLCVTQWRESDLEILLRSEGESALLTLIHISADQLRELYAAMQSCNRSAERFLDGLESELEQCFSLGGVDGSNSGSGSTEQGILSVLCSVEQLQASVGSLLERVEGFDSVALLAT